MPPRSYSRDEVQAILSRALEGAADRGDHLTHEELLAIGRELGIPDHAIDAAAAGVGDELAVTRAVDERVRSKRQGFVSHLLSFVLVNALLVAINLTTGGPLWFLWSVFGWGIAIAFHARAALLPDRARMAVRERKKIERDREREEKRVRRERARDSGKRIESAVEDVVAETLGAVADAISHSRRPRPGVRVDNAPRVRIASEAEEEELADEEPRATRRRSR